MNLLYNAFPVFFNCFNGRKANRVKNNIEWVNTFSQYVNLLMNLFKFEGLPETINERFMKMCLIFDGRIGIVNDPKFGILALRVTLGDVYNIYGDYGSITAYGNSYPPTTFKAYMQGADNTDANAVLIRDNQLMYPYFYYVWMLTDRLTDTMRSIDVSINNACFPFVIVGDESQKKTIEDLMSKIKNKEPAIVLSKGLNIDSLKVLTTGFNPTIISSQWDNYTKLENMGRQQLGIESNAEPSKSERLLVDEVNSNNEVTVLNLQHRIDTINECLGFANELFGLNMKCVSNVKEEKNNVEHDYNPAEDIESMGE